jgi:predicted transcriptional regulator
MGSPGGEPNEDPAGVIAPKIDVDRHLSARRLAQDLGIAAPTVCRYLTEVLGMRCYHLRWVPHMLAAVQKVARVELVQHMPQPQSENTHFFTDIT